MNLLTALLIAFITVIPDDNLSLDAWDAYLSGDFDRVEQIATQAETDTALTGAELAWIYLALGSSRAMIGDSSSAVDAFNSAFEYDAFEDLTAADLPPPVWSVFEPLRAGQLLSPKDKEDAKIEEQTAIVKTAPSDTVVVYRPAPLPRSNTLKSLAFPGWGHLSSGRRHGLYYLGAEAVLLTAFALSAVQMHSARDDYLGSRTPADIDARYGEYNRAYRLTWGLGIAAAATYLWAQYDFFTFRGIRFTAQVQPAP